MLDRLVNSSLKRVQGLQTVLCGLLIGGMLVSSANGQVATEKPLQPRAVTKPRPTGTPLNKPETLSVASGPSWEELTPAQRISLKPLAANWKSLEPAAKRKWIAVAATYPTLAPQEQVKLHSRMSDWSQLSKQERAVARFNFADSKNISQTQKAATWEAYQELGADEKKKLAASAPPKPAGAATAAKPVAPQKLATVPIKTPIQTQTPTIQSPEKVVEPHTMLPRPTQPIEADQPTE